MASRRTGDRPSPVALLVIALLVVPPMVRLLGPGALVVLGIVAFLWLRRPTTAGSRQGALPVPPVPTTNPRPEPTATQAVAVEPDVPDGPATTPAPAPAPATAAAWAPTDAPTDAPNPDSTDSAVRYSVLAPDVLTGGETTAPGSVAEGWYITSDRSRERWHNGSSWTAHERPRGSG